jgi:hypothetical protein
MKTSEMTGAALDWAVGVAEGLQWQNDDPEVGLYHRRDHQYRNDRLVLNDLAYYIMDDWNLTLYSPSTDWAQGGPIIEREKIGIERHIRACEYHGWMALKDSSFEASVPEETTWGETPLIAAMRCYVASKLGDEIEIPEELN